MANFNTHITVAAGVSLACGLTLYGADLASKPETLAYIALGTIGGILPDIDAEQSIPTKIIFQILACAAAFMLAFHWLSYFSTLTNILLWLGVYLVVRYAASALLGKITVHRGIIHSIPMAAVFACGTVLISQKIFAVNLIIAWLCGLFILLGFLTHLILDELYSVDLAGARLKKSFGSALTLFSLQSPIKYLLLYAALVGLVFLLPSYQHLQTQLLAPQTIHHVKHFFLPDWMHKLNHSISS